MYTFVQIRNVFCANIRVCNQLDFIQINNLFPYKGKPIFSGWLESIS